MNLETLRQEQRELAIQVQVPQSGTGYQPQPDDLVFSLDIQYVGELAYVAVDIQRYNGESLGIYVGVADAGMEYVPRFFCFREGPPLKKVVERVYEAAMIRPNLLVVDGHGLAHPRKFGVACWLGVQLGIPTIGVAKKALLHYNGTLGENRGSTLPILLENEIVGHVLRTQDKVKPVFVSVGHQLSLQTATQAILDFSSVYRIAEPIRRADQAARTYAKNETLQGAAWLGKVD